MRYVDKQIGRLLFERLFEIMSDEKLTPKEKIPKYRTLLDDLFKALTSDSNQIFSDLFTRSTYVFHEYDIPADIKNATHSLRISANKVVHETAFIPGRLDDSRCVYHLANVLQHFSREEIPARIKEYYKDDLSEIRKVIPFKRKKLPIYDFYAVVESIYLPKGEQAGKFCILTCNTDELGEIKLKLRNNKAEKGFGSDLSVFGELVEPFQSIYITEVEQSKDNSDEYSSTYKTLLVLEPDYLIDAKELSECRQFSPATANHYEDNPLLYILNRFTKGNVTDRIMVGNIAGRMLDDIVSESGYEFKKTFESVMRENSFGMLCMANEKGSYDNTAIQKIYIEAQDHEQQIKKTLKDYKGKSLILEPTFISNRYGLQGRLDLLIDYGKESNQKDIIELKSSRNYPGANLGLYLNHEAQTICYDLLVSSTYPHRTGYSSILYSSVHVEEKSLRNVSGDKFIQKQDLLMLRNKIVANEIKIARGEFKPFYDILADSLGTCPKYLEEQVDELRLIISNLEPILKNYFLGYLKFIFKELQVAKIGNNDPYNSSNGNADLWKASREEKIDNFNVLVNLKVKEITNDFHLTLVFDRDLFAGGVQLSSFRVGDTAILYPTPNQAELHPLRSQILKCRVLDVAFDFIQVSLINKQVDKEYLKTSNFWALDRDFRELGYKQLMQVLYEFLKSNPRVINLVLGRSKPEFEQLKEIPKHGLDTVQYQNVKRAIAAREYYLIQGPPGTGKTSQVLVEIVRNIIGNEHTVMIVAFTNRAVDEICEKLLHLGIDCIRLGKGDKQYYWSEISSRLNLKDLNEIVKKSRIFVSTLSTFASSMDILKFKRFDTLIIDEASQILEPQIVGLLKYFRKWIFIGDENQLPAVVLQSEDDSKCEYDDLKSISLNNFRESLFYRLKKNAVRRLWNDCHGTLRYQYRMHSDIAEFPRLTFYNNELEEHSDTQRLKMADYSKFSDNPVNRIISSSRVVFVPSKVSIKSKINEEEAKLASSLVSHIANIYKDNFDAGKTIGVITPFRAQIVAIRSYLDNKYKDITIDTVERYQGSERDIIILSLAIKSPAQIQTIQSINEEGVDRKLNVAITRAKEQLIILGSEEVMRKSKIFSELIEFIKKKGGYVINPLKTKTIPENLF